MDADIAAHVEMDADAMDHGEMDADIAAHMQAQEYVDAPMEDEDELEELVSHLKGILHADNRDLLPEEKGEQMRLFRDSLSCDDEDKKNVDISTLKTCASRIGWASMSSQEKEFRTKIGPFADLGLLGRAESVGDPAAPRLASGVCFTTCQEQLLWLLIGSAQSMLRSRGHPAENFACATFNMLPYDW
jgi:hypothetical protein